MNCIIIEDYEESRQLVEIFVQKTRMLNLIGSYASAVEAINAPSTNEKIDLVLLDIELPEMSGMEYLKTLSERPVVIILSAQEKYALEAFEYDVTDYILKPITYARFYKAVSKAYTQWRREQNVQKIQNEIFVRKGASLIKLSYDEILWVEALENYVLVITSREKLTVHFTLKAIMQKLPPDQFLQVHRSHIVNINKINEIQRTSLVINDGTVDHEIPVGKSYKEQLLASLNLMSR
ncbi:MAG: DNA-binding response regulator [Bacteroidetes bacterium GWF2_49_14]|nr:MAG: DNA-binding response regulator [Bacteroidetes bacterium GWF2_49_14]